MSWTNWKTEDIGIKVSGAPAVSSWKEGRLDVFVRATDGRLYHRVFENEAWQGAKWVELSDGHHFDVSPAAVSWGPDRIDLFAVWDKQVHHRAYQSGTWAPWTENLEGFTNDAPVAVSWKPLRVDVLVRTNDNHLSRRFWESGVTWGMGEGWKNWDNIGGIAKTLMSAPAAVATTPNRIDCFGRGATNQLMHASYQGAPNGQDGKHEDWIEIDTMQIKDAPAVVSGRTADRGRVDVFVRGTDDLLKHRIYYAVLQPDQPAGNIIYTAVQGDYMLKIARNHNMTLQALKDLNPQIKPPQYLVHPGDQIIVGHREEIPGYGGWGTQTWEDLSPNKIASAPAAVASWSSNILKRIDIFAQDANNNLIHTWWT